MSDGPGYPLRQVLPAEVLVGGNAVWSRYRQYPVFSARWLAGRSLLFCSVLAVVTAFTGAGVGLATRDPLIGAKAGLAQLVAFSLMAMLGPALATVVRHRRWPESRAKSRERDLNTLPGCASHTGGGSDPGISILCVLLYCKILKN